MLSLAVLLWLATLASRLLERRVTSLPNLTPSLQVLIVKLLKIVLVVIAVVVALKTVGIDLTAFAVLTGAVGVGIGFGLQKGVGRAANARFPAITCRPRAAGCASAAPSRGETTTAAR